MHRPATSESIAIVVVPRDRFSMFQPCLDAVYANTKVPFRVLVVSGGTDRTTEEYLRRLQFQKNNLRILLEDRLLTQIEARNTAMREVGERYCVVLENDTIVHQNWLPPLLDCMRDEGAAVVMPLIFWYRGLHAAGCRIEEREEAGAITVRNRIMYTGIRRKRIDYPESHCILIDREQVRYIDIFDEVEPFDVDLGLTLRKYGLSIFLEPGSTVTYAAPPPWEVRDIAPFRWRWDVASWERANQRFRQKWAVTYNASPKRASYQRQQLKLGLARWYPNKITVGMSNVAVGSVQRLLTFAMRGQPWGKG